MGQPRWSRWRKTSEREKACLDQLVVGYVGRKVCGETRANWKGVHLAHGYIELYYRGGIYGENSINHRFHFLYGRI